MKKESLKTLKEILSRFPHIFHENLLIGFYAFFSLFPCLQIEDRSAYNLKLCLKMLYGIDTSTISDYNIAGTISDF